MLLAILLCISLPSHPGYSAGGPGGEPGTHPEFWAQPVEGVRNLYKVSDDLYRSAQPKADTLQAIEELGVRTIVSVRYFHSGRRSTDGTGLTYERITIAPWHPRKKEAVEFLQIATDPERTPVLLHCYKGADRTGMLAAMYRIVVQGWTKEAAIEEMKKGGYGFNSIWGNLIRWNRKADIEEIRELVGAPAPADSAVPDDPRDKVGDGGLRDYSRPSSAVLSSRSQLSSVSFFRMVLPTGHSSTLLSP